MTLRQETVESLLTAVVQIMDDRPEHTLLRQAYRAVSEELYQETSGPVWHGPGGISGTVPPT